MQKRIDLIIHAKIDEAKIYLSGKFLPELISDHSYFILTIFQSVNIFLGVYTNKAHF